VSVVCRGRTAEVTFGSSPQFGESFITLAKSGVSRSAKQLPMSHMSLGVGSIGCAGRIMSHLDGDHCVWPSMSGTTRHDMTAVWMSKVSWPREANEAWPRQLRAMGRNGPFPDELAERQRSFSTSMLVLLPSSRSTQPSKPHEAPDIARLHLLCHGDSLLRILSDMS
jgi:hypothetical protein